MNFISPDRLFAKIEKQLSSYTSNALIDTGDFYAEIKWFIANLGLAVYERGETMLYLKDYKAELPCSFYLLDSAWLCSPTSTSSSPMFQAKEIGYTDTTTETICQDNPCGQPTFAGTVVSTCSDSKVLTKVTVREYINSQPTTFNYLNPVLLRLNNLKSVEQICSKSCQNLFSNCPDEISIKKQGPSYYLFSTIKEPKIYIKYWQYPTDEVTKAPLIPDDPIIEKGLEWHLVSFLFKQLYLNGDDKDIQGKVQLTQAEAEKSFAAACSYVSLPSFNRMIQVAQRERKKFTSYEIMNTSHY